MSAMTPLEEALERLSIVDVWRAAGGAELRHGRGPAFWRGSDDPNISIDPDKKLWHDLVTNEGGSAFGLVRTALGLTPGEAARWLIDLAGVEDRPLTRADRLERHRAERDAEEARLFIVAAGAMAEQCLEADSLFDPSRPAITALIEDIRRNPLEVFRNYRRDYPQLTRGLVLAGRRELERRELGAARQLLEVFHAV